MHHRTVSAVNANVYNRTSRIISSGKKDKISSERLQMLNKLSEDEVRNLLQKREQEKEDSTNENEEVIR